MFLGESHLALGRGGTLLRIEGLGARQRRLLVGDRLGATRLGSFAIGGRTLAFRTYLVILSRFAKRAGFGAVSIALASLTRTHGDKKADDEDYRYCDYDDDQNCAHACTSY